MVVVQLLALIGFFLSLAANLAVLAGVHVPTIAMGLHVGVFVVFFPAIFVSRRMAGSGRGRSSLGEAFRGLPLGMLPVIAATFVYAFFNFFTHSHGNTKDTQQAILLFSGHWMLFYLVSFCLLWSYRRASGGQR